MDSGKTDNERELTSTMGNVLSVSIKDEKNDTSGNDATPTSSTDANTTPTSTQIVSDDPISSTSSDTVELKKTKAEGNTQRSAEVNQTTVEESDKISSMDSETDLLEMSISSVSREKITEDVEDLVHDLESLLGESTDSFNIPVKRREDHKSEENQTMETSQVIHEEGSLSSENPTLDKTAEISEDSNIKDITKDINESSSTENIYSCEEAQGSSVFPEENSIEESPSKEEVNVSASLELEPNLVSQNITGSQDQDKPASVNDEETVKESENALDSQSPENTKSTIISKVEPPSGEQQTKSNEEDQNDKVDPDPELTNTKLNKEKTEIAKDNIAESDSTIVSKVKPSCEQETKSNEEDKNDKVDPDPEMTNTNLSEEKTEIAKGNIAESEKDNQIQDSTKAEQASEIITGGELEIIQPGSAGDIQRDEIEKTDEDNTVCQEGDPGEAKTEVINSGNIEEKKSNPESIELSQAVEASCTDEKEGKADTEVDSSEGVEKSSANDNEERAVDTEEVDSSKVVEKSPTGDSVEDKRDPGQLDSSQDTEKSPRDSEEKKVEPEKVDSSEAIEKISTADNEEQKQDPEELDSSQAVENNEEKKEELVEHVELESSQAVEDPSIDASEGKEVEIETLNATEPIDRQKMPTNSLPIVADISGDQDESRQKEVVTDAPEDTKEVEITSQVQLDTNVETKCKIDSSPTPEPIAQCSEKQITESVCQPEEMESLTDIHEQAVSNSESAELITTTEEITSEFVTADSKMEESITELSVEEALTNTEASYSETNIPQLPETETECAISDDTGVDVQPTDESNCIEVSKEETIPKSPMEVDGFVAEISSSISETEIELAVESSEEITKDENAEEDLDGCTKTSSSEVEKVIEQTPLVEDAASVVEEIVNSPHNSSSDVQRDVEDILSEPSTLNRCTKTSSSEVEKVMEQIPLVEGDASVVEEIVNSPHNSPSDVQCDVEDILSEPSASNRCTKTSSSEAENVIEQTPLVEGAASVVEEIVNFPHNSASDVQPDVEDILNEPGALNELKDVVAELEDLPETSEQVSQKEALTGNIKVEEEVCAQETTTVEISDKAVVEIPDDSNNTNEPMTLQAIVLEAETIAEDASVGKSDDACEELSADLQDTAEPVENEVKQSADIEGPCPAVSKPVEAMDCAELENIHLEGSESVGEEIKQSTDVKEVCPVTSQSAEQKVETGSVELEETAPQVSDSVEEANAQSTEEVSLVISQPVEEKVEIQTAELEETVAARSVEEEVKMQPTDLEEICPEVSTSHEDDIKMADEPTASTDLIPTVPPELKDDVVAATTSVDDEEPKLVDSSVNNDISEEVHEDKGIIEWIEDVVTEDNEVTAAEVTVNEIEDSYKETESVPFFTSGGDSDSEDTVPTLVLEPDEVNPSLEEFSLEKDNPILAVHSTDDPEIPDKLPEIEEILNDQGNIDDVESIDMQENLETILAVASLQNTDSIETTEEVIEPQISDKERKEMEALRKAVESITEPASTEYIDEGQEKDIVTVSQNIPAPKALIEECDSGSKILQPCIIEETIETKEVIEETVESLEEVSEGVSVNNIESKEIEINESIKQKPLQALPDTSEDKIDTNEEVSETNTISPDSSQSISAVEVVQVVEDSKDREVKVKAVERPKRHKKSAENKLEELTINVDVPEKEKPYSPKVTIKPIKVPDEEVSTTSNSDTEVGKGSLKMTITKQSDTMHSVLKIYDSENTETTHEQEEPIPKLIIKPKMHHAEQQHSPKMSTRSSKQMYSPTSSTQRSGSPRITIKPVLKPEKSECLTPLKIKIKPDEASKKHSPKLNIKPVTKSDEECRENAQSPRKVTIKPVMKPHEEAEQMQSPRITIKPIPKPEPEKESVSVTPRLNIKPLKKVDEEEVDVERERSSPKITIKPVVKPPEGDVQIVEVDDEVKERIVLKINKGNLPSPTKESKKREHPPDDEKSEKLAKITVKFSKGGRHPHIVHQPEESNKRTHEEQSPEKVKKLKTDESPVLTRSKHKDVSIEHFSPETSKTKQRETEVHVVETRSKHAHPTSDTPVETKRIKLKDMPETSKLRECLVDSPRSRTNHDNSEEVQIIETKLDSPIVISEDSRSQDSGSCIIIDDPKDSLGTVPLQETPVKANIETPSAVKVTNESASSTPTTPTPRKRGRPRKVPIVVREEFKDQEESESSKKEESAPPVHESGRPKRSCRGQSVRATLGIKPRKPRGPGRGRGSKRGMGTRVAPTKSERDSALSKDKLTLVQEDLKVKLELSNEIVQKEKVFELPHEVEDEIKAPAPVVTQPSETTCSLSGLLPGPSLLGPLASPTSITGASPKPSSLLAADTVDSSSVHPVPTTSRAEPAEIVMVDEETRMSADINSRAQTPAKQVVPSDVVIEESQSSVQSSATTESSKAASSRPSKAPRLEVQEPEGAIISADQLTEYYWNGNGPFMLQEQVAQFLGIKSFKRKYPNIMRRMLEMQERDFIRESGLASEHMCDLGLTAVNSADILDIMYSDFQDKYEEYCKHQRDRQAKELINKQKALSLAASQEKNKADITEQAVASAAQWNAAFNKTRREQRKACMDLQTLTVHYPKGKMKQINKPKVGDYPVSLVPGQFTDYYKEFTPTEINNLPLNTMCYNEINIIPPEQSDDSGSEMSDSDSDSSSSSSGSGSSSSGVEDCKLCKHSPKKVGTK